MIEPAITVRVRRHAKGTISAIVVTSPATTPDHWLLLAHGALPALAMLNGSNTSPNTTMKTKSTAKRCLLNQS